jgi:hydrogenase maturation protein HypF
MERSGAETDERVDFSFDTSPLLLHIARRKDVEDLESLALLFHEAIAAAAARGAERMRDVTGTDDIALSGGVFQNALLLELLIPVLEEMGFSVFTNSAVPPGDGGISLGQAYFLGSS